MGRKIILNVPHTSIEGIFDRENGWYASIPSLQRDVKRWTDWYTDFLFSCDHPDVIMKKCGLSRFVVDVERLINDPLEKEGRGIIYTDPEYGRRKLSETRKRELMCFYHNYRIKLGEMITSDEDVLIDCHSFPSNLAPDVSVCIGYNDDWSRPSQGFLGNVSRIFERHSLTVSFNNPFSNSITPETPYRYKSFMLEVNKSSYMDENTLDMYYYNRVNAAILDVYSYIINLK